MRRLVVLVLVGALSLATVPPTAPAFAQEPWQDETPAQPWHRDITPYVLGLGAIMGVIAFNIAAPPVAAWGGSFVRAVRNIGVASSAMAGQLTAVATGAPAPVVAVASAARPAAAAPIVAPLTASMLAQAQIGGAAAAAAGAATVYYGYRLLNWATGAAP